MQRFGWAGLRKVYIRVDVVFRIFIFSWKQRLPYKPLLA